MSEDMQDPMARMAEIQAIKLELLSFLDRYVCIDERDLAMQDLRRLVALAVSLGLPPAFYEPKQGEWK
jgi:hypothetical protein